MRPPLPSYASFGPSCKGVAPLQPSLRQRRDMILLAHIREAQLGELRQSAIILDLHSRRVIGWAVSNRMKRDPVIRAWKMPIAFRKPPKGCISLSDRGSQYCSHDYQKILRQQGFRGSQIGKGKCDDHAAVGTFCKTIKAELICGGHG